MYFFGASKLEGIWTWFDSDEALTYSNWAPGQGDQNENCSMMDGTAGNWHDVGCQTPLPFVCEALL